MTNLTKHLNIEFEVRKIQNQFKQVKYKARKVMRGEKESINQRKIMKEKTTQQPKSSTLYTL